MANDEVNAWIGEAVKGWPISLGVVDDGSDAFNADWKADAVAADERVRAAQAEGRKVIWIEDFGFRHGQYGVDYREEVRRTGVTAIDTEARGHLVPLHLRVAGLITEEEYNVSRKQISAPAWTWTYPGGSLARNGWTAWNNAEGGEGTFEHVAEGGS